MADDLVVAVKLTAKDDGSLEGAVRLNREALDKMRGAAGEATKALEGQSRVSKILSADLATLKNGIAALGLAALTRELAQSAVQMQGFEIGLKAATGSSEAAQRSLSFVREESRRLGLDFQTAAASFTQLAAAARGTSLEGEGARKVFTAVSEASRVLHLSAEATGGALNAVQQMISKGTVSAEELRGQLGERLPGAFQIAARAMGVTTQQLDKMLQQGQVVSEDFLPKFAEEVRKTFSGELPDAVDAADANFKRFGNAIFDLKVAFGKELLPSLVSVAQYFTDTLIPTFAFAAEKIGLIERNINSLSEGELRLRQEELSKQQKSRQLSLDAGIRVGRFTPPERARLTAQNDADLKELQEIEAKLKAIDERNQRIVKLGLARVETEEAAAVATGHTAAATDKAGAAVEKLFKSERQGLEKRIALVEDNTESARILFETTEGRLKALAPAEKEELKRLADKADLIQDTADVEEYLRGVSLDREREWASESKRIHDETLREQKSARDKADRESRQAAKRQAELVMKPFENALEGIQSAFSNAFENIFSGGVRSFGDLGKQIKQVFIKLAAEIATLLVFKPVMSGILGAVGLNGIASSLGLTGGAPGGGITLGGSGGLFSGGFNLSSLLGGMQSEFGASIGINIADMLGAGPWGQSFAAGAGLNAPWAIAGGLLNNVLGIDNGIGSSLGGLVGGGLGSTFTALGAFGGPVGAIAGTMLGGLIGGLFGGKPKRDVSAASVFQSELGKFSVKDKGGPAGSAAAKSVGARLAAELNALTKQGYKLNFNGGFGFTEVTNADKAGGDPFYLDFVPGALRSGFKRTGFQSADALIAAVLEMVKGKGKGIKETPEQAAAKSNAKALLDAALHTNQFVAQVKAIIAQFADLRTHAKELGLSLSDINKAERSQLTTQRGSVVDSLRSAVQQGRQILGIPTLEAFKQSLSFGGLSPASPAAQLSAAREELNRVSRLALRGDADAIQQFPGLAQTVLGLARDTYASGEGYQSVFRDVNSTLGRVLDKQKALETSLLSGITITLQQTSAEQIAEIRTQTKELVAALKTIDGRLKKVGR